MQARLHFSVVAPRKDLQHLAGPCGERYALPLPASIFMAFLPPRNCAADCAKTSVSFDGEFRSGIDIIIT